MKNIGVGMSTTSIILFLSILFFVSVSASNNPSLSDSLQVPNMLDAASSEDDLSYSVYQNTCQDVEGIIYNKVKEWVKKDPTLAPSLIRLHFHDCAVRGCDASILLDHSGSERSANVSKSLRGFEVINDIKAELEKKCPKTVSCADILTTAARDATVLAGGPFWTIPFGRKDGRVSLAKETATVPVGRESITTLIEFFQSKGKYKVWHQKSVTPRRFGDELIGSAMKWPNRVFFGTGTGSGQQSQEPVPGFDRFPPVFCRFRFRFGRFEGGTGSGFSENHEPPVSTGSGMTGSDSWSGLYILFSIFFTSYYSLSSPLCVLPDATPTSPTLHPPSPSRTALPPSVRFLDVAPQTFTVLRQPQPMVCVLQKLINGEAGDARWRQRHKSEGVGGLLVDGEAFYLGEGCSRKVKVGGGFPLRYFVAFGCLTVSDQMDYALNDDFMPALRRLKRIYVLKDFSRMLDNLYYSPDFAMVLLGDVVRYHNIANDLKHTEFIMYKPQSGGNAEGTVVTTIGFNKEAPNVSMHGFNIYNKNRFILQFQPVVLFADSRSRGVIDSPGSSNFINQHVEDFPIRRRGSYDVGPTKRAPFIATVNSNAALYSSSPFVKPVELKQSFPPGFKQGSNLKRKLTEESQSLKSELANVGSNMIDMGNNGYYGIFSF
ncbi:hypothetical protein R6Q59_005782 [Mikania micrantha]